MDNLSQMFNLFRFLCYTPAALNGEQFFWEIVLITLND